MLSICIPVYNYDIGCLAKDLHHQAVKTGYPFEILAMDDALVETFREKNRIIDLTDMR